MRASWHPYSPVRLGRCRLSSWRQPQRSVAPLRAGVASGADGFIAEYALAGIKLDATASSQLHSWYQGQLTSQLSQVSSGAGPSTPDAPGSKELPPLPRRRPGVPQLTVLWDLESIKPFTQQNAQQSPSADAPSGGSDSTGARGGAAGGAGSGGGGRASRSAAAGLPAAASAPDLIGALDQLCRTLKEYGTVHAVHLFLRESVLGKAPALRRQVEQLRTWVDPDPDDDVGAEAEAGAGEDTEAKVKGAQLALEAEVAQRSSAPAQHTLQPADRSGGGDTRSRGGSAGGSKGAGRRPQPVAPAHDCPMCRSAHPTRLALLSHFASVHQAPVLAATASDARTHIMWTRGRAVMLPVGSADGTQVAAFADSGNSDAEEGLETEPERVLVNPQEFVYARELLMRGRHLDELLAAAPVVTRPCTTSASTAATGRAVTTGRGDRSGAESGGGHGGGGTWAAPGVHLHLVSSGQTVEEVAAALLRAAEQAAAEKASVAILPSGRAQAGRSRGRSGGRRGPGDVEPPPACLCVISDAEGVEQVLAAAQRRGILTIAVTRVARVTAADASLRWWAVQGSEYRLDAWSRR